MSDLCIACSKVVGKRQHGITCDVCDRWQHRVCGTGITREQYFTALCGGEEIKFVCEPCIARIPPRDNDGVEVGAEAVEILLEVQDILLKPAYSQRSSVFNYVRQLLVLPFLPANHIRQTFEQLHQRANTDQLQRLVNYIDRQY